MRVVFIGSVEFSRLTLKKLLEIDCNIVGVCLKKGSTFNSDHADLSPICIENKIPFLDTADINTDTARSWISSKKPDVIFCFGWSSLLGSEILEIPPMGVLGYHPAKLPENRGRHPLIWALALGLKESASTFFMMDRGADSGDIVSQVVFEITGVDDALSLYNKMVDCALEQLEELLPLLVSGSYDCVKQDNTEANTWRKRGKQDGKIDFRMSSSVILNLIRALTKPYVGAHLVYGEKEVIVWKAKSVDNFRKQNVEPGKVLAQDGRSVTIKTADGAIEIIEHEFTVLPLVGEYL